MPIRPEHRFFYPIDWPQLSETIRFRRAQGRCEECARPHLQRVFHLGDGRWWDAEIPGWRDGQGRRLRQKLREEELLARIRVTKVVLATAHRDHDTANNEDANLAAFCQRCNMLHDRDEHQRRRWHTVFQRKAMGGLFQGQYPVTRAEIFAGLSHRRHNLRLKAKCVIDNSQKSSSPMR